MEDVLDELNDLHDTAGVMVLVEMLAERGIIDQNDFDRRELERFEYLCRAVIDLACKMKASDDN